MPLAYKVSGCGRRRSSFAVKSCDVGYGVALPPPCQKSVAGVVGDGWCGQSRQLGGHSVHPLGSGLQAEGQGVAQRQSDLFQVAVGVVAVPVLTPGGQDDLAGELGPRIPLLLGSRSGH